jgi:hypothetical protein
MSESIKTIKDLTRAIDDLSVEQSKKMLKEIAATLYLKRDGTLDGEKSLGADQWEEVCTTFTNRNIWPTK